MTYGEGREALEQAIVEFLTITSKSYKILKETNSL